MTSLGTGDINMASHSKEKDHHDESTASHDHHHHQHVVEQETAAHPHDENDKTNKKKHEAAATTNVVDTTKESAAAEQAALNNIPSPSIEINYTADKIPEITQFHDHFTLLIPSSTVRYRDGHSAARIIESPDFQVVLEETYCSEKEKHTVSIRRIQDASVGVRFLRLSYAIVTAFWTGFFFIFCLQVLLFLFLDLAIQAGATSKQDAKWGKALGAILAFPGFVYGLSCALVIAGAYIMDTWRGHYLIRNFTFKNMRASTVEWIFFLFFLGLPLLVMCGALLSRVDNWWEITILFWFACVVAFYIIFTANVIFYEMQACWLVTKNKNKRENDSWFDLIQRSIHSRQQHMYSGRLTVSYLAMGSIRDSEYTDSDSRRNIVDSTYEEKMSIRSKWTTWHKFSKETGWGFYESIEPKKERIYTIDDARDVRPYVTSYTWSLEKIFCRPKNSRYIAIIRGPGAVTQAQMRSSIACSGIGSALVFLIFFSVLYYLHLGVIFTIFMLAMGVIVSYPTLKTTYGLYKTREELSIGWSEADKQKSPDDTEAGANLADRRGSAEESECVYFVQEVYRITRPTIKFCYLMFFAEVSLFFVYPLASLFSVGNYPLGIMFIVFAGVSLLRYYVNAAVVLEETGRMDLVDGANEAELWKNQSRLNEIVGNITRGRSLGVWMSVLGSLGFVFLGLMLGAVGSNQEVQAVEAPKLFLNDFEYIQADSLRYPTCRLSNDLGTSPLTSMADYAFLAGLAYRSHNITQADLDGWFGGEAIDQEDLVQEYRRMKNTTSAVSFKLVTFPNYGNFAYVLIRGTTNNWDMLTDAQLWSAAALMQIHRALLPFGVMWSSIIDDLIKAITTIESASIDAVSFYRDTTAFVNFIKANKTFSGVGITGHSLGGGLSIITGAQTGVPAVALSGPNALLSRSSFNPPISIEDLDSKTFNIIPARDIVPMIDDVAQNWQSIRCQADFVDVVGCHNSIRSLCEILYSCGTNTRPFLCDCMTEFNYPEPVPKAGVNTTLSVRELCGGGAVLPSEG